MLLLLAATALATPHDDAFARYGAPEARIAERSAEVAAVIGQPVEAVHDRLRRTVRDSLLHKHAADLELPADAVDRTVVDFEAFRLQRYVTSGVFPKRYFGYLDLKHDTADLEWRLRTAVSCTRATLDDHLAAEGVAWGVDDAELAITFIAEGGALLMDAPGQAEGRRFDPVFDFGLDDIAKGVADEPELIAALDARCGTGLGDAIRHLPAGSDVPRGADARLPAHDGHEAYLLRRVTFEEGVVGTALMWLWEKRLTADRLAARGSQPLEDRSRAAQFVASSLMYNSGIPHAESTHRAILDFSLGPALHETSQRNARRRWELPLLGPAALALEVLSEGYRDQPTSWNAAYHVLQRYGAWEAVRRFTDVFDDDGRFRPVERPATVPAADAVGPAEVVPEVDGAAPAGVGWLPFGLGGVLVLLGAWRVTAG